jgi:hypothetical protein
MRSAYDKAVTVSMLNVKSYSMWPARYADLFGAGGRPNDAAILAGKSRFRYNENNSQLSVECLAIPAIKKRLCSRKLKAVPLRRFRQLCLPSKIRVFSFRPERCGGKGASLARQSS